MTAAAGRAVRRCRIPWLVVPWRGRGNAIDECPCLGARMIGGCPSRRRRTPGDRGIANRRSNEHHAGACRARGWLHLGCCRHLAACYTRRRATHCGYSELARRRSRLARAAAAGPNVRAGCCRRSGSRSARNPSGSWSAGCRRRSNRRCWHRGGPDESSERGPRCRSRCACRTASRCAGPAARRAASRRASPGAWRGFGARRCCDRPRLGGGAWDNGRRVRRASGRTRSCVRSCRRRWGRFRTGDRSALRHGHAATWRGGGHADPRRNPYYRSCT